MLHSPSIERTRIQSSIEGLFRSHTNFFISPDFRVIDDYQLQPFAGLNRTDPLRITVGLRHTDLPRDLPENYITDFISRDTNISMRSRAAQLGMVAFVPEKGFDLTIDQNGIICFPIDLYNYGPRSIILNQGEGIGALYYDKGAIKLRGTALENEISKGIMIRGLFQNDWIYVDQFGNNIGTDTSKAVGLAFRLNNERFFVTPGEPVSVFRTDIADYRNYLLKNGILQPNDEYADGFWIGRTAASLYTLPHNSDHWSRDVLTS